MARAWLYSVFNAENKEYVYLDLPTLLRHF